MLSARSVLALAASGLTLVAVSVSVLDTDTDEAAFFAIATLVALLAGVLVLPSVGGSRRTAAKLVAGIWMVAGVWIGVLLIGFVMACGCSLAGPPPPPATYLGLTATAYHLIAMYGATALIAVAAFGRSPFLDRALGRSRDVG